MSVTMKPVDSSNVAAIGYDPEQRQLHVEFKGGARYIYHDVPPHIGNGAFSAPSAGGWVHGIIKPNYRHSRA